MVAATESLPKPISTLLQEHRYMNLLLETMLDGLDVRPSEDGKGLEFVATRRYAARGET